MQRMAKLPTPTLPTCGEGATLRSAVSSSKRAGGREGADFGFSTLTP